MSMQFSRRSRRSTFRSLRRGDRVRRRANRVKKYARRSRGAKAQSRQIVNLSKAVSSLAKRVPDPNYNLAQGLYHRWLDVRLGSAVYNTSFQIFPILPTLTTNVSGSMPEWRTWGPGVSGAGSPLPNEQMQTFTPAAKQGSVNLKLKFSIGAENDSFVNFGVYVVTMTKDIAAQLSDSTAYGYDLQGMTDITQSSSDPYFCRGGTGTLLVDGPSLSGIINWAPDKFRVLKKEEFCLTMSTPEVDIVGTGTTLATNPNASTKMIDWNIPMGYTINPQRKAPWSTIEPGPEFTAPQNVRYLIVTTDNSSVDLEYCYMNGFASTIVTGLV